MALDPARWSRRLRRPRRLTESLRRAGRVVFVLGMLVLAACRSPASPGPPPSQDPAPVETGSGDATVRALPPPELVADGDPAAYPPGRPIHLSRTDAAGREVTLWFSAPLAADAAERIKIEPEQALLEVAPAGGDDLGRPPTGIRLLLSPPPGDAVVTIQVDPALAAADGRTLAETAVFELVFSEPTYVRLAVTGAAYAPGDGEQRFTAEDTAARPPVLRPGPAALEAQFTRPVDRESVEAALQHLLPPGVRAGMPAWNDDGTQLHLPLFQNVTANLAVSLSLAPAPSTAPTARDALGMPLTLAEPALAWIVAAPAAVAAAGPPAPGSSGNPVEVAGQLPNLPLLDPVGADALRGGRLLAWHRFGDTLDCERQALMVWDLKAGSGVTLGDPAPGCSAWAAWLDDHTVAVVDRSRVTRYRVPADLPLAELVSDLTAVDLWTPAPGDVVGAALAPGAPIAVFHAAQDEAAVDTATNLGGGRRVDLLILDDDGGVGLRVAGVSDLIARENGWESIPAAWSPRRDSLAFVTRRASAARDPAGYPQQVDVGLAILETATGQTKEYDLAPLDFVWRPGGRDLWVRTGDGWFALDPATGTVEPVPAELWWAFAFSPDGRYLVGLGAHGPGILDAVTGAHTPMAGYKPLGWDPHDGRSYWHQRGSP